MKRITAFLLAIVMVFLMFPVSTLTNATAITEKPFYCVNMAGTGGDHPLTYSMPYFYCDDMNENTEWPRVSCYGTYYEAELAQKLKEDFDNRPAGSRYFQLCLLHTAFFAQVENVIYFDKAVETVKLWLTDFLAEYKKIGGQLDGIIVDLEYFNNDAWYNEDINIYKNSDLYRDIITDPRYAAEVKPRLQEYGFDFSSYEGTGDTELITISRYVSAGEDVQENTKYKGANAVIWDHVVNAMEREAINEAVLYPMQNFYPDATVSDYQSGSYNPWEKAVDEHGNAEGRGFITVGAGNLSNQNSYNGRPSYAVGRDLITPPGYNDAYFEASPFASAQYDVNLFKNMYASTEDGQIDAWIAHYWYEDPEVEYASSFCETPYYTENLYHIGLLDPETFLGYLIVEEIEAADHTLNEAMGIVSDILQELTRVAGTSDRKPIQIPQTQSYWNAGYILSGMYAGGRNIWRLTPDTDKVSLEDFKIKNKAPTFSVDGVTITFPQGRIIEDSEISIAGSCGYWIETPADVVPVITGCEDRYSLYPAFLEDFEDYTAGASFTASTALPANAWEVSGTATVRANGTNNQSLGLTGNTTVKSVKLPENVTAGDAYAKQQVWETTVTIPSGLDNSASIKLLYATNNDSGFTIKNNKVCYNGSTQLAILTAGNTYTLRREMDFQSYKCTYTVLDANGSVLGKAENVSIPNIALPTASISFTTTSANKEVLIDNYKLYATGVSTVLELYDTQLGQKVTDTSAARTADTAYRMSWMNGTNEPVVAEIYDTATNKVFETVEMAPNMDGYVTGIVSANASSPVTLAVRTVDGTASTLPDYDNGDFDWPTFEENMSQMGKAYIKLPGVNGNIELVLNEGETVYLLTNANGKAVSTGASAENYNIKFTYPENGTPTLYLKGAYISNDTWHAVTVGRAADAANGITEIRNFSLIIHVESDSTVEGKDSATSSDATYSAFFMPMTGVNGNTITVTGPGKLTATSQGQWPFYFGKQKLIFKDANVVATTATSVINIERAALYGNADLVIDNSVVDLSCTSGPVINLGNDYDELAPKGNQNKLTIRNGSDVKIANPVSESYLPAVLCGGEITIDRSVVEIITRNKCFDFAPKMILVDSAVAGSSAENTSTYDPDNASSYQYFKTHMHELVVIPAVRPTCLQSGLTEGSRCTECGETVVAQTVVSATGHVAGSPVIENVVDVTVEQDGSYHKVTNCAVCGVELDREVITVPVPETRNSITVKLVINNEIIPILMNEGMTPRYLRTYYGQAVQYANEDTYNIKIEYPMCGAPTIYLRNAKLINKIGHALDISSSNTDIPLTIHTEADSTLTGLDNATTEGVYGAVVYIGNLTFTGPGKLTATSQSFHTIYTGSGTLTFKDANVSATANVQKGTYSGIMKWSGDIVIDNSTVEAASTSGYGMLISRETDSPVGDPYDIVIKNGSHVKISGVYSNRPVFGCTGEAIVSNSTLEVQGTDKSISQLPVLSGVTPYGGSNATNAQLFNEKKIDTYSYFKTVPCTHTGGTATCDEKAICTICGYYYGDFAHVPETDDGDCTTAETCMLCGKTVIYAYTAHNPGAPADCVNPQTCTICSTVLKEANGHTYDIQEAVEATCDTSGLTEGKSCTVCGEVFSIQQIVYAKGHTAVTDAGVAPSCTSTGLTEGSHCSVCNKVLFAQSVIPATGHISSVSGNTTCEVCGVSISGNKVKTAYFQYLSKGVHNTSNAVETITMTPGSTTKYFTTVDGNGSYANYSYLKATDDTVNYAVKIEYPVGGVPTLYLNGVELYNDMGIQFGHNQDNSIMHLDTPLNIVVEKNSYIRAGDNYVYSALSLFSTNVTITSVNGAQLHLVGNQYNGYNTSNPALSYNAVLYVVGNLTLDNANVLVTFDNLYPATNGVVVKRGDLTIDNSKLVVWANEKGTNHEYDLITAIVVLYNNNLGGKLLILNDSDVLLLVDNPQVAVSTSNGTTISDSKVEVATEKSDGKIFDNKVDLIFTNAYYAVTSASNPVVDNAKYTLQAPGNCVEYVSSKITTCRYFKVEFMHVHANAYLDNGDGTHDYACSVCGDVAIDNEAHDFTSGEEEGTCICGATSAPACDHANATYTNLGDGNHSKTCECGEVLIESEAHDFTDDNDATCDKCGYEREVGPTYDANLYYQNVALSLQSGIVGQFIMYNPLTKYGYDTVKITVVKGDKVFDVTDYDISGDRIAFLVGFSAKEMTEKATLTIYGTKDGKTYYGESLVDWTIKDKAIEMLNNNYPDYNNSKKPNAKKTCDLVANMLYYGTQAQLRFDFNKEEGKYATDGLAQEYLDLIIHDEPTTTGWTKPADAADVLFKNQNISLSLGANIQLQLRFALPAGTDITEYHAEVTNLTRGTKYEDIPGSAFTVQEANNRFYVFFDGMAAQQLRETLSITLYKGDVAVSTTFELSVENLADGMLSNATNHDVVAAMMNYSDCAKIRFAG